MDKKVFDRFCAEIRGLSVGQIRMLSDMLGSLDARVEVFSRIDQRQRAVTRCLQCGDARLHKWGETRTGLQRVRCQVCGKTFSSSTRSAPARVGLPELFLKVVRDMFADTPLSCRKLAARLKLDKMTVWRWRQRITGALTGAGATNLGGIVEADEKLFRESRKGSREWVNHRRNPMAFPKPDRPRWCDYKRLGRSLPTGGSKYQMRVLTISDRSGARRADVMPDHNGTTLISFLARHIGSQAVLCSDGDTAYAAFAGQRAIPHYVLNASRGPHVLHNAFHIQTINNLHSRFEVFMKAFRGPASKNLPAYSAWFVSRLAGDERAAVEDAWKRLLAA